jgi:hypothetical protein
MCIDLRTRTIKSLLSHRVVPIYTLHSCVSRPARHAVLRFAISDQTAPDERELIVFREIDFQSSAPCAFWVQPAFDRSAVRLRYDPLVYETCQSGSKGQRLPLSDSWLNRMSDSWLNRTSIGRQPHDLDLPSICHKMVCLSPIPVLLKLAGCLPLELGPQMEPAAYSLSKPLGRHRLWLWSFLSLAGSEARN